MEQESYRRTEDLVLAAALIQTGQPLRHIEANGGSSRVSFCFDDYPEVQAAIARFRAGQLRVEPQQFAATIRMLRAAAREEMNSVMRKAKEASDARPAR